MVFLEDEDEEVKVDEDEVDDTVEAHERWSRWSYFMHVGLEGNCTHAAAAAVADDFIVMVVVTQNGGILWDEKKIVVIVFLHCVCETLFWLFLLQKMALSVFLSNPVFQNLWVIVSTSREGYCFYFVQVAS